MERISLRLALVAGVCFSIVSARADEKTPSGRQTLNVVLGEDGPTISLRATAADHERSNWTLRKNDRALPVTASVSLVALVLPEGLPRTIEETDSAQTIRLGTDFALFRGGHHVAIFFRDGSFAIDRIFPDGGGAGMTPASLTPYGALGDFIFSAKTYGANDAFPTSITGILHDRVFYRPEISDMNRVNSTAHDLATGGMFDGLARLFAVDLERARVGYPPESFAHRTYRTTALDSGGLGQVIALDRVLREPAIEPLPERSAELYRFTGRDILDRPVVCQLAYGDANLTAGD